jgi:hypothetical protein
LRAERVRVDGDQQQVALSGKMLGGGFLDLIGRRKMNVAVGQIHRGAGEFAGALAASWWREPRARVHASRLWTIQTLPSSARLP